MVRHRRLLRHAHLTAAEYKVSEVADRNAGIVLKIDKDRLQSLLPAT